ncbi:MAG: DUF1800 domain-containing protein [Pyrinomonadaceae bacterium]
MNSQNGFATRFAAIFVVFAFAAQLMAVPAPRDGRNPLIGKKLSEDQKALHVLNRLGFGPREGDLEKVKSMGIQKYIDWQLEPEKIDDSKTVALLKNFEVLNLSVDEIFAKYPNPGAFLRALEGNRRNQNPQQQEENNEARMRERRQKLQELYQKYDLKPANQIMSQVQASRILRATYSERQLEEVMVDFWSNHFNVYSRKGATRFFIPSYERDVIRKNALGNFKDLLTATAQHPAMLFYLDNFQSVSPDADGAQNRNRQRLLSQMQNGKLNPRVREQLKRRGRTDEEIDRLVEAAKNGGGNNQRGINENYARELMELHTLGVDGGYTSDDIKEVARAFTGWTIYDANGFRRAAANMVKDRDDRQAERQARQLGISANTESGTFVFASALHDKKPKTVLGVKIDDGGIKDGLKVIDLLANHPSTAKFIARKLAVKFVNDEPSEALVNDTAAAFTKSKGDIKTTLRALFNHKDFYAADNYRAKIKTPFELMVSSLRALNADARNGRVLIGLLERMGEPLYGYQAPTGYPDKAVDWVNTGGLLERMNFAVALASNRLPQVRVDLNHFKKTDQAGTLNTVFDGILHGEVSDGTKSTLAKQMAQPLPDVKLGPDPDEDDDDAGSMMAPRGNRNRMGQNARLREPSGDPEVVKVVSLVLGSPEFQRQ